MRCPKQKIPKGIFTSETEVATSAVPSWASYFKSVKRLQESLWSCILKFSNKVHNLSLYKIWALKYPATYDYLKIHYYVRRIYIQTNCDTQVHDLVEDSCICFYIIQMLECIFQFDCFDTLQSFCYVATLKLKCKIKTLVSGLQ